MSAPIDDATSFYDALAPLFDVMTDWDARLASEGPFLRAALEEAHAERVLDAACGSGGHGLALARWGYTVAGADASPAMIALARSKATQAGLSVPFDVAGLAELPERLVGRPRFDAVFCLGNSLPHVLSQEDLVSALSGMAAMLRPGGLLVTQNLNYDLRWRTQPRFFAAQGGTLEGREVLVWRFADYDAAAGRIAFHIALFNKGEGDWHVRVHTTPQRPLFQVDLVAGLQAAGFSAVHAYGQMSVPLQPFEAGSSPDLVVMANTNA